MAMEGQKKAQAGTQAAKTNTKGSDKDTSIIEKLYFQKLDEFLDDLPGVPAYEIIEVFDLIFNLQHMRIIKPGEVQWTI